LTNPKLSGIANNRFVRSVISRIGRFELTPEIAMRIRFALMMTAVLALILAFQVGDDWYVREFANYDWARNIGY
jgi:hypothetical protein